MSRQPGARARRWLGLSLGGLLLLASPARSFAFPVRDFTGTIDAAFDNFLGLDPGDTFSLSIGFFGVADVTMPQSVRASSPGVLFTLLIGGRQLTERDDVDFLTGGGPFVQIGPGFRVFGVDFDGAFTLPVLPGVNTLRLFTVEGNLARLRFDDAQGGFAEGTVQLDRVVPEPAAQALLALGGAALLARAGRRRARAPSHA